MTDVAINIAVARILSKSPDIGSLTLAEIRVRLDEIKRVKAACASEEIRLTARMHDMMRDERPVHAIAEVELMEHAGLSGREARTVLARTNTVRTAPEFGELLAQGHTTVGHLDALQTGLRTAASNQPEFLHHLPKLSQAACSLPVGEFAALVRSTAQSVVADDGLSTLERQRRCTYLKIWNDSDGMTQVRGAFDPESGAALHGAICRRVESMFHSGEPVDVMPWVEPNEHRQARAVVALATRLHDEAERTTTREPRAEVVVHVDLATLTQGLHSTSIRHTEFGADLPVDTIRRLACEAEIVPVVLNGESVPLDVGRSKRLATVHQRRALEASHRTCAIPECEVPYHHCQIHHIDFWESGGSTDLHNMIPLCSKHHHAVHEGGWTLRLVGDARQLVVDRQSG
ncbi:MAG: DUF222 domain-containing protein [Actinobacteria bacterium]|nr:DUF222 domain-containing protein [Actinomycetota bacterium]